MKKIFTITLHICLNLFLLFGSLGVSNSAVVPQTNWSLVYVDSQEVVGEDGRGINSFDGNAGTIWHTEWKDSRPPHPHEIQIDLGATYELESFRYLPRQDGSTNGRIKDYAFYVSDNSSNWGNPVASGTFANLADEKTVVFNSPAVGRFIRLVALNEVSGKAYTSMAEINVVEKVENPTTPLLIPQTHWSLVYVDSQEILGEDGRGINSFDGNAGTIWHTEWKDSRPPHPHEIQIDLGATYELESFRYLPRQDGITNGRIKDYEFYVSDNFSNWGNPVASGTFANLADEKTVVFNSPAVGRFIRLVALNEVSGKAYTSMAEINVAGIASSGTQPPNGVVDTPTGNVTIDRLDTVFFTGTGTDPASLDLTYLWKFGDTAISDSTKEDPGNVQFNNAGSFTVTFTVTNSAGLSDFDTRIITVKDPTTNPTTPALIPKDTWNLVYVDSEELIGEDGRGENAFDGNFSTNWHTEWLNAKPSHPHEIQIDLGKTYELESFSYLPRQDWSSAGRIKNYSFYVSNDRQNWGRPFASGTFVDSPAEQTVVFDTLAVGRYIRLVAFDEVKGQPYTSVAEINLIGIPFSGNFPPRGNISTPAGNLTIISGDALSFSGIGSDPDNNVPLNYHWNFGDPHISDAFADNPGSIRFNNPGTYEVTFTVTDSLGLVDGIPPTRIVKVVDSLGDTLIPQNKWSLKYVDSQELVGEDGRATNAFDGNPGTIWHTEWKNSQPPNPHEIQIDLGGAYTLDTFQYLPRQDASTNGRIKDYAVFVSGNGVNWEFPVAMGSFANSAAQKTVLFSPKTGRFIKLVSLNEVSGKPYASAAEIKAEGSCNTPYVKFVQPLTGHIQTSRDLKAVAAVCLDQTSYPGWGVKFTLSDYQVINEVTMVDPPYEYTFEGLEKTEHEVEVHIVDQTGQIVNGSDKHDRSVQVGLGDYYVAIGDSITVGEKDDILEDNQSQDGRNIQAGYTPILNDLLTASRGFPHSVVNEGIAGIKSAGGLAKLPDVLERHPNGRYYLILYGTNDSSGLLPVPSGQGLNPGDSGYPGSFKDNLQQIINAVLSAGKVPYLSKVPFTLGGSTRNNLIQQYNVAIDELVSINNIIISPPDFFSHFQANQTELADTVHPNGRGYQSMANLWHNSLLP